MINLFLSFIIIIIILFLTFKIYTIESFENTKIHPVIEIAKETSYLETLKKENKEIKKNSEELKAKIKEMQTKLDDLTVQNKIKENEKINIESKIADINKEREINLTIAELVKQSINKTLNKEEELKKYEKEIETKKNQEVVEKENKKLSDILLKLEEIKKINDFCSITKDFPQPIFKSYKDKEKDLSFEWCNCDDNKTKKECIDYQTCKNNYDNYKDSTALDGENLVLYFNCLKLYPEFPRYLTINNSKKI